MREQDAGQPTTAAPGPDIYPTTLIVEEAGAKLRAPWAASVAGLLFAALLSLALILIRMSPIVGAADEDELVRLFAEGADTQVLVAGLYLLPFSGIMYLWFVAVLRDQLGEREDRFFATIFFGSGMLFVAMVFAAGAAAVDPFVGARYLGMDVPTVAQLQAARALAYTLLFGFATRAAAVCVISVSSLALRSRAFPNWFGLTGYALGLVLLLIVTFWDWILLLLPVWVAAVSLFILRRERIRARGRRAVGHVDDGAAGTARQH